MTEFERLSGELTEVRRERDAWRELALAQADLMKSVTSAVIEHKHVITLDGRTLADSIRKYSLSYQRRNPLGLS
jgi:hypothetical protein